MSKLQAFFAKTLSLTAYDLCDLQAAEGAYNFVTVDGYYCSALKLEGAKHYLGERSHPEALEAIHNRLKNLWKDPGRQIQTVFVQDPEEGGEYAAEEQLDQLKAVAKRLKLDLNPIIEERRNLWLGKVFHEGCYIIIKTSLAALNRSEQQKAIKEASAIPYASIAQDPSKAYSRLFAKHDSFVTDLENALDKFCVVDRMSVQQLGRVINTFITGRYDSGFKLKLAQNDKHVTPPRMQESEKRPGDPSPAMQPPIPHQFFTERPRELDDEPSLIKIHNRYIAPIQIETWSDNPAPFNQLVARIDRRFPFAISMTYQTGKDSIQAFLGSHFRMAKLAQIFNKSNSEQAAAAQTLRDYLGNNGANAVLGRMALITWSKDKGEALTRKEELSAAVTAWCGLKPVEYLDNPVKLWIECIPGLARKPVSIPSAIKLDDALAYLPIDRPATVFKEGSMPLFSTDYKFMPYKMGAEFQVTWNNNWFAPPGSGKSVGLFGSCLSLILNEENKQVPKQVFIDYGPAGEGLVKLFKAIFGPERAHRARHITLLNDGSVYINPFDTMTCCRRPNEQERRDIIAMLSIILSPNEGSDNQHMSQLIQDLVTKLYELRDDSNSAKGDPKPYKPHVVPEIDHRLTRGDIKLEESPYWWEVADALLYAQEFELANKATRQAVPLLRDVSTIIAQDEDIKRKFGDIAVNGNPLLKDAQLFVESFIQNIPILSAPTNFDATETDLLVLNLQKVVSTDDPVGRKMSAAMFLLSMIAGAREFFQEPSIVNAQNFSQDPAVKAYHRDRISRNFSTKRHLILDEYHVFNQVPSLDKRIIGARRIGRKNNTVISLATQFHYHVTEEQQQIATNTFFMSADDKAIMDDRQVKYQFSDDIKEFALQEQTGPGTMLHYAKTKQASTWQVCRDLKGPIELWAFSSTREDVDLRSALEERKGFWEACRILGREFPSGSLGKFQPKYTRYLQKTFNREENLQDIVANWHHSLAKSMLAEPDTWRLHIQEEEI
ncbi:hypothetical protein [Marinobacter shengliensis]|uniref:hypothetical protein n=1 Tax=Marinobacter shengliensis TaxID=1389223 RepID=UPI00110854FC|nr:hypothetical protein [Marinobacter shengliensis]